MRFECPVGGMQLRSRVQISKPGTEAGRHVIRRTAVMALWDTGAVTSAITRQTAERLRLRVYERAVLGTTAGEIKCFKDIVLLDLQLDDGRVLPVKAAVVEVIPGECNDFLIGMDVMQCGEMTVGADHERGMFQVTFTPYPGLFRTVDEIFPEQSVRDIVDC